MEHITPDLMIADNLNKGMSPLKFKDHVENMRLWFLFMIVYIQFINKTFIYYGIFSYSCAI
jgi:hypothetical protein